MEVFEPFWLRFFGMGGWISIAVAHVNIQRGWWGGSVAVCDLLPPLFSVAVGVAKVLASGFTKA